MNYRPIGVYDSGVGGLTVVKEIGSVLPAERVVYFGDTARMPYGGKSVIEIERYSREIINFLEDKNAKLVIMACNTSSAFALPKVKGVFGTPVVDVLRPGARAAASATRTGRIGVIATEGTAGSKMYEKEIRALAPEAEVFVQPCPLLVPLVEAGKLEAPETWAALREYLDPLVARSIDTLVLGCTHYPYLGNIIREIVGPDVIIVDPAGETAIVARRVMEERFLLRSEGLPPGNDYVSGGGLSDRFFTSGDPAEFATLGSQLLGRKIARVEHKVLGGSSNEGSQRKGETRARRYWFRRSRRRK